MCTDSILFSAPMLLGDVIAVRGGRGGTTVEVIDSDAEGRLFVSAILRSRRNRVVDVATRHPLAEAGLTDRVSSERKMNNSLPPLDDPLSDRTGHTHDSPGRPGSGTSLGAIGGGLVGGLHHVYERAAWPTSRLLHPHRLAYTDRVDCAVEGFSDPRGYFIGVSGC
jgi:hypothetical protein